MKPFREWICVTEQTGSGMASCIHKYVSEDEFTQSEKALELGLDDEIMVNSFGEWPVVTLEEAKAMFNKVLGDDIKASTNAKIWENLNKHKFVIRDRLSNVIRDLRKSHKYDEWQNFLKKHKKEAMSLQENIRHIFFVA